MILYHFSIARYEQSIRENGVLSMAEKKRRGMYPDGWEPIVKDVFPRESELVWFTRDPDGNAGIQTDEAVVRVTVDIPDAERWKTAADRYRVPEWWRELLRDAGLMLSSNNSDSDWYLVERTVTPDEITNIEVLSNEAQPEANPVESEQA